VEASDASTCGFKREDLDARSLLSRTWQLFTASALDAEWSLTVLHGSSASLAGTEKEALLVRWATQFDSIGYDSDIDLVVDATRQQQFGLTVGDLEPDIELTLLMK